MRGNCLVACSCTLLLMLTAGCPRSRGTPDPNRARDASASDNADASDRTATPRAGDRAPGVVDAGLEVAADSGMSTVSPSDGSVPEDASSGNPPVDAASGEDAGLDTPAFEVLSVAPDGEIEDPKTPLRVTFSAELDGNSVRADAFSVKRDGTPVVGKLTIERDVATFEPDHPWVLGASYELDCTAALRDTEGRALAPRSARLRVRDGRWKVEERGPAMHQPRTDLVVSANGNAALAWVSGGVQLSRYAADSGWTEPERISSEMFATFYPSLAIDDKGRVLASYNYEVNPVGRVYLPESGWQPPFYFRGVPGGGQEARRASWILSDAGDAVGVFSVFRLPPVETGTIDAIRFDIASEERTVHAISPNDPGFDADPQLAWLGDQSLFAWVEDTRADPAKPRPEIWVRHGVEGATRSISAPDVSARSPALAGAPDRNSAWLVWEEERDGQAALWATKLEASAANGPAERISEPYPVSDLEPNPVVAVDARGAVHVAWEQPSAAIWSARFEPGKGWSKPLQLSAADAPSTQPILALEPGGNAILLWSGSARGEDRESTPVLTSRYVPARGWSAPAELAPADHGVAMLSNRVGIALGVDHAGRAWACWAGHTTLHVARFD